MSSEWSDAPIFYMIGQIRFGAVLSMPKLVSSIQDLLRHKYPDFAEEEMQQLEFRSVPGEDPQIKSVPFTRWQFKNISRTAGYVLGTDFLSFHTTDYSTSNQFFEELLTGFGVVNEKVGLSYVESVGVRSLDAVIPCEGKDLDFFLKPGLLGFHNVFDSGFKHSILETVTTKHEGVLTSRVVTLRGTLGLPVDLAPLALEIRSDLQELDTVHVILDNDCIKHERIQFEPDQLRSRLAILKQQINSSFQSAVQKQAIAWWSRVQ